MEDATCSKSDDGNARKYTEGLQAEFLAALDATLLAHHERLMQSLQLRPQVLLESVAAVPTGETLRGESSHTIGGCSSMLALPSERRLLQEGWLSEEPGSPSGASNTRSNTRRTSSSFKSAEALKRYTTLHAQPPVASVASGASRDGGRRLLAFIEQTVLSDGFDVFMSLLILSNALFCGVEVEYMAWSRLGQPPPVFYWISLSYTIIFAAEIALRFGSQGRSFFWGPLWKWNTFDLLIIAVSVLEACVDLEQGGSRAVPSVRVVRMVRLVRVLRIVRIMRHVRSLRILICSVLNTLRSLFWTLVLLFTILYVFGLLFTQAAQDHLLNPDHAHISKLEEAYGTLGLSMLTLFKSISGGMNWEDTMKPLSQLHPLWMVSFLIYFTFVYFAVLNVVTGVFCQTAIESAGQDHEMAAQAQIAAKQVYIKQLERLFKRMNTNNTGFITLKEFEESMEDEQLRAYFASIELTIDEAFSLFKLLDCEGHHTLSIDAFVTGCLKLRGQAKTIDIAIMMYETRWNLQRCLKMVQSVQESFHGMQAAGVRGSVILPGDFDTSEDRDAMCL